MNPSKDFCVSICVDLWDRAAGKSQMNQSAVIASAYTAGGMESEMDR